MSHTVELPNGDKAEFPDQMTPDQISAVLRNQFPSRQQSNQQQVQAPQQQNRMPDNLISGTSKNLGAGLLNSIMQIAKGVPDLADVVPPGMEKALLYQKGERPADNFDAYKTMGIEDKPFYTPEGAMQTAGELLIPGPPGYKAGKKSLNFLKNQEFFPSRKTLINSILEPHDSLEKKAVEGFKQAGSMIENKGIKNFPVSHEELDEIRPYFSKTRKYNSLFERAKKGDFEALRTLQSDLYSQGKKKASSTLSGAERNEGEEMLEKRDIINDGISDHLKDLGHDDIDKVLNEAKADYRELKDTYYPKNMAPALIKMFDKNVRSIPNNLHKVLLKDSVVTNKLRERHPGLEAKLNRYNIRKNAMKLGAKTSAGLLGALIGIEGYKHLS